MSALNLPTPAEDMPVDYAAHVLKQLQARLDLAAVERQTTADGETFFTGWHTSKEGYVCYLLYADFLVKQRVAELKTRVEGLALEHYWDVDDAFSVFTGLVVPGATETAARLYQRLFDLPLLTIPIPSAFVPMESEVMP